MKSATCSAALTLAALVGLSGNQAFAENDCGSPVGGTVTCSASIGDYATGIIYDIAPPDGSFKMTVDDGTTVTRAPGGDNTDGIRITNTTQTQTTVELADDVTINTDGVFADGVDVGGNSGIIINSGADISVDIPTDDLKGTNGLYGWIEAAGTGDIVITQRAGSTITVTSANDTVGSGSGLYGYNLGSGSVDLRSSGNIAVTGYAPYGLNAWNESAVGKDTTAILNQGGTIDIDGDDGAGVYSLNKGYGKALAEVHGTITVHGDASDGALADIDNELMSGTAETKLSSTADIHTFGNFSKGAWVLNWGTGDATVTSEGKVVTVGEESHGLLARISLGDAGGHGDRNGERSEGEMFIHLAGNGSVATEGLSAYGIFAENVDGDGAATVVMDAGTSVTTEGVLANGINGLSGGTVSFEQASGAKVTVSGIQAFGVNLDGKGLADADLRGTTSSIGEFGVGASSFSSAGSAEITVGANATVTGGWQTDVDGLGLDTDRASAGVLIGSGTSSHLTNLGSIGAASDRAIADIGRQAGTAGKLVVDNGGIVTGFVQLADGGENVFNNGNLFDVRHFADTDGDGVADTKRVSTSDFGAVSSSFNNLSGATVRLASVLGDTDISAAGYYRPTTGVDNRPLEAGYYALGRSGIVQGQFTNLGTFHNAGIIDLRGSATGNTLVMTGNAAAGGAVIPGTGLFVSDGGQLWLNTFFNAGIPVGGQTGSFSDVLVVDSTEVDAGATSITIDRRQGPGAFTPGNGILLVEVRGSSDPGAFVLNGDFVADGQQQVVGGAYRYALYQNGVVDDTADGNWYLRNLGYSPNVPVYEEYPKVLLPLIDVPTLQQRVGNRYWNDSAPRAAQTVFCKDPAQNYQCTVTDDQASYYVGSNGTVVMETNGIWGRIEGAHGHYESALSTGGAQYDANSWKMQAGLDGLLVEAESGKLIGGVTVNYGHVSADVTAAGSDGSIDASAYGVGGTLTWYGTNGFYADAQAQATWLDSDLGSATLGRSLVDGNNGFGYTLSLEAGQRIAIDPHWTLTPQAQLIYSNVRFDSFTDPFGSNVSLSDGDSLRGRLGLAAEYQKRWTEENGTVSRFSGYGIANLYNEFLDGTRVNVSGTEFASRDDRLWGGLGLGGSYNWNDDKYSVYGEVSSNTGLKHFGDSFEIGGTLGLRVKW